MYFVFIEWQNADLLFVVFSKTHLDLIVFCGLEVNRKAYACGSVSLSFCVLSCLLAINVRVHPVFSCYVLLLEKRNSVSKLNV